MLREKIYPKIEQSLNKWAEALKDQGFTARQLTLGSCAINFLGGCLFARGHFFLGGLVILVASLGDLLDGPLAQVSDQVSKFGDFIGSVMDAYSDFFILGGAALFAKQGDGIAFILCLGILLGAFITSYSKSRAETLGEHCPTELFERPERILLISVGAIFTPLLGLALWVLCLGANLTAIKRILQIQKALSADTKDSNPPT